MVLHYASGRLCEQHYVCGTTPESLGILIAATLFEPIGKLLVGVNRTVCMEHETR